MSTSCVSAPSSNDPRSRRALGQRLPRVGAVIEREHDGKAIRSLSAIAREATGTSWNGLLFFHVIPYAKREKKTA